MQHIAEEYSKFASVRFCQRFVTFLQVFEKEVCLAGSDEPTSRSSSECRRRASEDAREGHAVLSPRGPVDGRDDSIRDGSRTDVCDRGCHAEEEKV